MKRQSFHLHLLSDSTGETLMAIGRAAAAQYQGASSMEHIYPLVRTREQLDRAIAEIETAPGMVLYTLVEPELSQRLEDACRDAGAPALSVLEPILNFFQAYIGMEATPRPGAQHMLDADYFRRIEALNYTMMHDDGANVENYEEADVVLLGVSRTSKTPTSSPITSTSAASPTRSRSRAVSSSGRAGRPSTSRAARSRRPPPPSWTCCGRTGTSRSRWTRDGGRAMAGEPGPASPSQRGGREVREPAPGHESSLRMSGSGKPNDQGPSPHRCRSRVCRWT